MNTMNCIKCNEQINPQRLKILPKTRHCVNCSNVERVGGHTIISGKNCYSELQVVDMDTARDLARKQTRHGYGVSNGVRFKFDHKRN